MKHSVSIRWVGVEGYQAVCTCGWGSDANSAKSVVEYQATAHRRTTRDFDPGPEHDTVDTIVLTDPDADHLPHGCIDAVSLLSLSAALLKLQVIHGRLHGTLVDSPCLRRIEATDNTITAHISVGPSVGGDWVKLVHQSDGTWKEEEK